MKKILSIILIIALSLALLVVAIEYNSYNLSNYKKTYIKHDTSSITNKSMDELIHISEDLISYLKGHGGDELLTPQFNEREVLHMRDVIDLFNLARSIKYISILVSLLIVSYFIYNKEYLQLGKTLLYGPFILYIILAFLGILAFRDFNKYFTYFHLLFFTNDLWLLDPDTDLMIQMLQEDFFMGIAFKIGLFFFINLSIIQVIGYLYKRKENNGYDKVKGKAKRDIPNKQ